MAFQLQSSYKPTGDQPQAIEQLVEGIAKDYKHQVLKGVTGSGKTFTMANLIDKINKPTIVLAHNKTLAAQLYDEYRRFFPDNAVRYFVSYYDYYQPEAYMPKTDTYIEKEADVNAEIERLRLSAMNALLTRQDVIVVASVSCIYNIGQPDHHRILSLNTSTGQALFKDSPNPRQQFFARLVDLQYKRNDTTTTVGSFSVQGDVINIHPPYQEEIIRIELWDDEIEAIKLLHPVTRKVVKQVKEVDIFPAKAYIVQPETIEAALDNIRKDLDIRLEELAKQDKILEAQRLKQRTNFDLEMLENTGYCSGIENYSIYFDNRKKGQPPYCLLDYFPEDFLIVVDESHMTIPQVRGMYNGDRARKEVLVDYGFRLPSALDNRPLKFEEFLSKLDKVIYTSATPADWEIKKSKKRVIEQIIRPTGLLDPEIEIKPTLNQIDDVLEQVQKTVKAGFRVLITTLTKKMSEDLAQYLKELNIKVTYLHSEIDTLERIKILYELRRGTYDVLVGVNLLREGIDLPEVSLVLILDADKEGFLRSRTSLVQLIGRAARHQEGKVVLYADNLTGSIKEAVAETKARRQKQMEYNEKHHITPKTIEKELKLNLVKPDKEETRFDTKSIPRSELKLHIKRLEQQMFIASNNLEFEKAAKLRDQIKELKDTLS